MKRVICLMLALLLLLLTGCQYNESGGILEPVEFYYPRKSASFIYGTENGVLTAEIREASGHVDDLNYLLTMYFYGPQDDNLRSPFPAGCALRGIRVEDDTLYIRLSESFTTLEGTELTLACAALANTCFSITDFTSVCIDSKSDKRTVSMMLDKDSLLFADSTPLEEAASPENPQ